MKYFFDTEFIERIKKGAIVIDLISIGIVSEDDRKFYYWNKDAPWDEIEKHDWLKKNVLPYKPPVIKSGKDKMLYSLKDGWLDRKDFASKILEFVGDDKKPEFWAYYGAYDWVVFCSLFGAMIDLPEHFPMFCMDIMQLKKYFSVDKIPIKQKNEHSALADAEWNKKAYEWLEIL